MGAAGKPCGVRKYSLVARNSQCHLARTGRRDVQASVPPPHGDAVAEGTELRSQQEARRVGGGPATMTAPRAPSLRPQSQNREITSLHLPSAAAFGTTRSRWPPAGRSAYWGSSAFLWCSACLSRSAGSSSVLVQLTLNQRVAGSSPAAPTM